MGGMGGMTEQGGGMGWYSGFMIGMKVGKGKGRVHKKCMKANWGRGGLL